MGDFSDKALFDAIIKIKAAGMRDRSYQLTQTEVDGINAIIHARVAQVVNGLRASPACAALMHGFERCVLKAYPDPGSKDGKPVTIGWGSTTDEHGAPIALGTEWTQERADARFMADLARFESGVNVLLAGAPTTQQQFDALVSFAYNVGLDMDHDGKAEGLGDSSLLRFHKAGKFIEAAAEFPKWNKNDGKVMNGLITRRAAERKLYSS